MRLLVCDDDPAIGKLLHSIYTTNGWDVTVVTSGQDCLDAVAGSPPDLIVLDHMMPGLTGIETAQELRDSGYDKPIVLFSAYLGPDLAAAARELDLMPVSKVDIQAVIRVVDTYANHPRLR
jgi:CheY-like chemotaxis protein